MFHTRLASLGEISNSNCHPFKQNRNVLAMNGTESDYRHIADKLKCTDTEAILRVANGLKIDLVKFVKDIQSVFIGMSNKKVFVTGGRGSSFKLKVVKEKDALIFASEFPSEFNIQQPKKFPFCWVEGEDLNLEESTPRYFSRTYPMVIDKYDKNDIIDKHCGWERYLDYDYEKDEIKDSSVDEIQDDEFDFSGFREVMNKLY